MRESAPGYSEADKIFKRCPYEAIGFNHDTTRARGLILVPPSLSAETHIRKA
ncbi:MAG: hypothetical protein OEX77_02045 [Candidatus Bathyarchaeota archaeon]|nr:hypothetical protein [Candidatus Bathyarchaeota archaeon]